MVSRSITVHNPLTYVVLIVCLINTTSFVYSQTGPDTILYNGKIFTSDPKLPSSEAVAISSDRIQAVGVNAEIKKLATGKTRLIDLEGRTVVPGFNDAHTHYGPIFLGTQLNLKAPEPTWDDVTAAIRSGTSTAPKGEWILGTIGGTVLNDPGATGAELDRLAPDHPVLLSAYFGHGAIFNSAAKKLLKISATQADPVGGRFERDRKTKKLTGRMFEYAHWHYLRVLAEQSSDEQLIGGLNQYTTQLATFGITSIQVMPGISTERFIRLAKQAGIRIRMRVIPFSDTTSLGRDMSDITAVTRFRPDGSNVTASGIKWILDGTPIERGAAMRSAYLDKPASNGALNFNQREIENIVRESLDLNQQLLLHAVGDRAVEAALDAMEKVGGGKIDWPSKRVRIEHGEGVSGDLIARAKKLGIIVVQNPSHFTVVDVIQSRWGKDTKLSAQRSLIDLGIHYAIGSDGPINPFLNIMFASIHPARPAEAITREQAVRAYTAGSAFAELSETKKGSIAKGMLADLAVLSQDIFAVPADALPGTTSVMTIVGGKIVYDAKVLK